MASADTVVVAHGKSEVILCENLRKLMRFNLQIYSAGGGEETIALPQIEELFETGFFSDPKNIVKKYGDAIEHNSSKSKDMFPKLKIFTLMDIDGNFRRGRYMSGQMFNGLPLGDKVIPIYNDDNLDEVMDSIGMKVDRNNKARSYAEMTRKLDVLDFYNRLLRCENTNMD